MLLKDPLERISMMQILAHPWVTRYKLRDEDSEPEESEHSLIISEEDEQSVSRESGGSKGEDAAKEY